MNKPNFAPYVGPQYASQPLKLLVLGESHYFGESDFEAFHNQTKSFHSVTQEVVEHYIGYLKGENDHEGWMNTYSKFFNVLFRDKLSSEDLIGSWEKCCFYNYVQFPTGGPRTSPTEEEFEQGFSVFQTQLEVLKPDLIIVWGYRLFENMPQEHLTIDKSGEREKYYYCGIPVSNVPHPSSSKYNYGLSEKLNQYLNYMGFDVNVLG